MREHREYAVTEATGDHTGMRLLFRTRAGTYITVDVCGKTVSLRLILFEPEGQELEFGELSTKPAAFDDSATGTGQTTTMQKLYLFAAPSASYSPSMLPHVCYISNK